MKFLLKINYHLKQYAINFMAYKQFKISFTPLDVFFSVKK
tara:strand:- start:281 stop:400 length:120 start_codon:yes stop_codon:yes gene_type:complete